MIGLVDRERIDAELYDDFETDKARDVSISYFKGDLLINRSCL